MMNGRHNQRVILGYTFNKGLADDLAADQHAQVTRRFAVHIDNRWYLLSSVFPITVIPHREPPFEAFDPCI